MHTTRPPTQSELPEVVLTQFVSPDDEHDVLETSRVKNKNKYIERNLYLTLVIRHMMHVQQNIKSWLCVKLEGFQKMKILRILFLRSG